MAFRKTETSLFAATSFAIVVEHLLVDKVMKATPNPVVLIVSMIKSWLNFLFLAGFHDIELDLVLRTGALVHQVVHLRFVKLVMDAFAEVVFFNEVKEYIFASDSSVCLLGHGLFA